MLRRLARSMSWLVTPAFLVSCALAVVLSVVSAAATRSGLALAVVMGLGMSGLALALWIPEVYRQARRGRQVLVLDPEQASPIHRAAYRATGAASLVALAVSIYLAGELWVGAPSKRSLGVAVPMILALVFLLGIGTAFMIRQFRHRATAQLLILTLGAGLLPKGWGTPAAALFLLATVLNFVALRQARRTEPGTDRSGL